MMKKIGKIVFSLLFFISCSCEDKKHSYPSKERNSIMDSIVETKNKIIGLWNISVQINNGVSTKCNVCPKVRFDKENMGKITKPSKEELKFKYHLYEQKIVFYFEEIQNYFDGEDESEFYYKIYDEDNLEIFELSSVNGKNKYILYRENE